MSVRRSLVLAASFTLLIAAIMLGCSKSKSTNPSVPTTKELDSPNISPGDGTGATQQFVHTFSTAGTFHYHCNIHPAMVSQIVVVSGGLDSLSVDIINQTASGFQPQAVGGVEREQPPVVDERDALAALGLVEVRGGEQDAERGLGVGGHGHGSSRVRRAGTRGQVPNGVSSLRRSRGGSFLRSGSPMRGSMAKTLACARLVHSNRSRSGVSFQRGISSGASEISTPVRPKTRTTASICSKSSAIQEKLMAALVIGKGRTQEKVDRFARSAPAVGPAPRGLQRTKLQPQTRGVQPRFLAQLLQQAQRFLWLPLFQRDLCGKHQARPRKTERLQLEPCEVTLRGVEVTHIDGCAGREKSVDRRRARYLERLKGLLLGLAESPFEQRNDGGVLFGACALQLLPAVQYANLRRKAQCPHHQTDSQIEKNETADDQ